MWAFVAAVWPVVGAGKPAQLLDEFVLGSSDIATTDVMIVALGICVQHATVFVGFRQNRQTIYSTSQTKVNNKSQTLSENLRRC